jgi:predicted ATP-binding protein involved in virulence
VLNTFNASQDHLTNKKSAFENAFNPQIDFSNSVAWFINKASQEALEAKRLRNLDHDIPELSAVREAISKALGEYGLPFVNDNPPNIFISPNNQPDHAFLIEQLSDGFKTMLALVMDFARRMAVANDHVVWPEGQTVLNSPGIALIDEVELHLHPSWQQTVLPNLLEVFPNTQFIVTTHSPQVLTSIPAKHIRALKDGAIFTLPETEETEGANAARVLEDVLGVNPRPVQNNYASDLNRYAEMVYNEKWDTQEAEELRAKLEEHYRGSEPRLDELALHVENSKWERG